MKIKGVMARLAGGFVGLFSALILFVKSAFAQGRWWVPSVFTNPNTNLQTVVATVVNIAFAAAGIVAVVYLIVGGFRYVTSGGNPDTVELAKATILNAVIGLIVIVVSYLIVRYVLFSMGVNSTFLPGVQGGTF